MSGPKQIERSGRADAGEPVGGPVPGGKPTPAASNNRGLRPLHIEDQENQDSILSPLGRCSHLQQAGKPHSGEAVEPPGAPVDGHRPAGEVEAIDARDEARVAPSVDLREDPETTLTRAPVAQPKGHSHRSGARANRPNQRTPRRHAQPKSREAWAEEFDWKKRLSRQQEQRVARAFGGRCVPGSGSLGEPGDVKAPGLFISCKSTKLKDLRAVESDHIVEVARQAEDEETTPVIAVDLASMPEDVDREWVLVPMRIFRGLLKVNR